MQFETFYLVFAQLSFDASSSMMKSSRIAFSNVCHESSWLHLTHADRYVTIFPMQSHFKSKSKSEDDEIFMQMKLKSIFCANICSVQLNAIWISGALTNHSNNLLKAFYVCNRLNIHIALECYAQRFALK